MSSPQFPSLNNKNIKPPYFKRDSHNLFYMYHLLLIIGVIIFIFLNNIVIPASAVPFGNFSGSPGRIGEGNGYFDSDSYVFGLPDNRNIYAVAEDNQIILVEPLSFPLGSSSAITLVNKGTKTQLRHAIVASDGYMYFVDNTGIQKKKTRGTTNPVYANDSSQVLGIYSSTGIYSLQELEGYIYFMDGYTLKKFDLTTYTISTVYTGVSGDYNYAWRVFRVAGNGSFNLIHSLGWRSTAPADGQFIYRTGANSENQLIYTSQSGNVQQYLSGYSSFISSKNYIYARVTENNGGVTASDPVLYNSECLYTPASPNPLTNPCLRNASGGYTTGGYASSNGYGNMALGKRSKTALYVDFSTGGYNTFQFLESGDPNNPNPDPNLIVSDSTIQFQPVVSNHTTTSKNISLWYQICVECSDWRGWPQIWIYYYTWNYNLSAWDSTEKLLILYNNYTYVKNYTGVINITPYINAYNMSKIKFYGRLVDSVYYASYGWSVSWDYIIYDVSQNPNETTVPIPTVTYPMPSAVPTATPIPTGTVSSTPGNISNQTNISQNLSGGLNTGKGLYTGYLNNITQNISNVSSQLSNYNYSTQKNILHQFLPILNIIPIKVLLLGVISWILAIILLLLGR